MPRALSLIIPEGVVVLAAVALARFGAALPGFAQVAGWLPWLLFLSGAAIAWRFHRGRLFMGLLALAPLWGWTTFAHAAPWHLPLAVGTALALLGIGWAREKRLSGWYVPFTLLLLGLGGIAIGAGLTLTSTAFPSLVWGPLPSEGTIVLAVAVLGLVIASLVRADGVAQGALWATVATGCALVAEDRTEGSILVAGAAGALVAGTLESIFAAAYRDALTGLPSRRALDERLGGLTPGAVVAMLDVDHFKQFNDTYGHDTGDQVLRMVAWRLAEVPEAEAFRYGGEEFTLIFASLPMGEVLKRLEGARAAVAASKFTVRAGDRPKGKRGKERRVDTGQRHGLSVTVSIGAALLADGEHPLELVKRADDALYKAKEAGRDRVIAARNG